MEEKNFRVEQLASKGTRFINFAIDWFIIFGLIKYLGNVGNDLNVKWVYIFIYLTYYTLFEWLTNGKTIGKYLTKTRAIKDNGGSIEFKEAFIRSLIRIIPLEPSICLFTDYGYGWHDRWTNTIVVPDSEIEE
jgi:uncharacterized RDD family membrane protein YckC